MTDDAYDWDATEAEPAQAVTAEDGLQPSLIVNWRALDPEQRAAELAHLSEWVAWMVNEYGLDAAMVPDCWAQHTALVQELSALHIAWQVAFDEADGGYGPVTWHDQLARALDHRAFHHTYCASGTHRDDRARTLSGLNGA